MKIGKRMIYILVIIMAVNATARLSGQSWPQWRGADRDSRVEGFKAPSIWPVALNEEWKINVGFGDATPALAGDRMYVFTRVESNEILQCINAETGILLWKASYPAEVVTGPAARHPGPRSTPTVVDGKVVIIGATGIISCLNAESGEMLWRNSDYANMVPVYFTGMSPLVVDNLCYAHLGSSANSAILAFDLATGSVKWKYEGDGPSYASPGIMNIDKTGMVIMQTDSSMVALGAKDGKLLWNIKTIPVRRYYNSSSPIISGNTIYYSGQGEGTAAISVKKEGNRFSASGEWRNPGIGNTYNTAVLKEGYLYGLSDRGYLYCLDAANGETAWADTVRHRDFGSVIDAGKVMVALSSTSNMVVFEPVTDKYAEIAQIKVSETPTYAHPVLSGNRIYIKDEEYLVLFRIK